MYLWLWKKWKSCFAIANFIFVASFSPDPLICGCLEGDVWTTHLFIHLTIFFYWVGRSSWPIALFINLCFWAIRFGFESPLKFPVILNLVEPNVVQPPRPCDPNPCGTNAQCKSQNGAINCVCPSGYVGDPYSSCRPECLLNTDCPRDQSCSRNKCVDPCPGTCGINADCRVTNHVAVCSCKESYTGDPYGSCRPIPAQRKNNPHTYITTHYARLSSY